MDRAYAEIQTENGSIWAYRPVADDTSGDGTTIPLTTIVRGPATTSRPPNEESFQALEIGDGIDTGHLQRIVKDVRRHGAASPA